MNFLNDLEPLLRTFWYIAIPVSIIFLVQTILTFVGSMDASDGISADFDSDLDGAHAPFQLFSLRNLINFLLGFSWTGISFYQVFTNPAILIALSLLIGILFVYSFFLVIRQILKLSEDNSFRIADCLHKNAEVYLNIPAGRAGKGRVLISVKGSVHELSAISEEGYIPTGALVKVTGIDNNNILIVKPI